MLQKLCIFMAFLLLSGICSAQSFVLAKPDTARLKSMQEQGNHAESLTYLYLKANYKPTAAPDSTKYYTWGDPKVCAFNQEFESGISYSVSNCEEGKAISETLVLPRVSLSTLRSFIQTLYYEPGNTWVSPLLYEPEEVGCFYEIIEANTTVKIEIYCGC